MNFFRAGLKTQSHLSVIKQTDHRTTIDPDLSRDLHTLFWWCNLDWWCGVWVCVYLLHTVSYCSGSTRLVSSSIWKHGHGHPEIHLEGIEVILQILYQQVKLSLLFFLGLDGPKSYFFFFWRREVHKIIFTTWWLNFVSHCKFCNKQNNTSSLSVQWQFKIKK